MSLFDSEWHSVRWIECLEYLSWYISKSKNVAELLFVQVVFEINIILSVLVSLLKNDNSQVVVHTLIEWFDKLYSLVWSMAELCTCSLISIESFNPNNLFFTIYWSIHTSSQCSWLLQLNEEKLLWMTDDKVWNSFINSLSLILCLDSPRLCKRFRWYLWEYESPRSTIVCYNDCMLALW